MSDLRPNSTMGNIPLLAGTINEGYIGKMVGDSLVTSSISENSNGLVYVSNGLNVSNGGTITSGLTVSGNISVDNINMGGPNNGIGMNDASIIFRGPYNSVDKNHYMRFGNGTSMTNISYKQKINIDGAGYGDTTAFDGLELAGNQTISFSTRVNNQPVSSVTGGFNPLAIISSVSKETFRINRFPNSGRMSGGTPTVDQPDGHTAAVYIANYNDESSPGHGLIIAQRRQEASSSIIEGVNLFNGYNRKFKVDSLGQMVVWRGVLIDCNAYYGGSGMPANAGPVLSLAIGDTDTGFSWNSDGNITAKSNGNNVFTWDSASGARVVFHGAMSVQGTKSAVVPTSIGDTYLYAVEAPENRFEDFGEDKIGIDGYVLIKFDKLFTETIETNGDDYNVMITGLDESLFSVVSREPNGFKVKGEPDARFMYRVAAWRKDYYKQRFNDALK